ncbi:RBBP9/YdeN family alpha/beta hydrolase [Hamadaea tsunoensis]|uniref:RBBP9/YdeN family alpha/beta hydrolase n=1 Tax=Hamadaea tsunoensis TaxID=53368 RepID=UPI00048285D2|nr:alpha/beta fold hydrolase [Hamadaea tsunoensis]
MWSRTFLILHGVENRRPADHWEHHLARSLRERGEQVFYPQLPDPDRPVPEDWFEVIAAELAMMRGERIVVAHSLGAVAWLHVAARSATPPADRVLLVSPPGPSAFGWDAIAPFTPADLDLGSLRLSVAQPRLTCSDNDHYCPEGADQAYGVPLGADVDLLPGAGHITIGDGYGDWPSVLGWCLDPANRLTR